MADKPWDESTIALLINATRALKFDWNAIANKLSAEVSHLIITPAICRQQYAKEYSKNVKDETPSVIIQATPSPATVEASKAVIWDSFDKMSLDELIDHVNKKEQEMNLRKEAIFQRVLNSLGNSEDANSQLSDAMTAEIEDVKKKYFESVQQKELEKLSKQQLAYDQQEKASIEKERQKLKKRFDADSVDNIGENPLGDAGMSGVSSSSVASALSASDSAALAQLLGSRELSGSAADKQLFASLLKNNTSAPNAATVTEAPAELSTDLESILMGDQFDILLSEIEKELDSQSQDKVEEEPSELFEVLSMLENAAKQKKQSSSSSSSTAPKAQSSAVASTAAASAANVASSAEYLSVFGSKPTTGSNSSANKTSSTPEVKPQQRAQPAASSRRMKPVDEQSDSSDDEDEEDNDVSSSSSRGSSRQTSPVKPPSTIGRGSAAMPVTSAVVEVKKEPQESSDSESEKSPASPKVSATVSVETSSVPSPVVSAPVSAAPSVSAMSDAAVKVVTAVEPPSTVAADTEDSSSSSVSSQVTGSLSSSAAVSGVGNRRVKGKLGSIMSNSSTRGAPAASTAVAKPISVVPSVDDSEPPVAGKPAVVDASADVKYVEPKTFIKASATVTPAKVVETSAASAPVAAEVSDTTAGAEPPIEAPGAPLTHCTMEPIAGAPVLTTLNLADKTGNALVYQIVISQSKLSAEFSSDVPLALILQWLFKILRGNDTYKPMKICGLQSCSSVVVPEGVAPQSSGCKCIVTIKDSLSEEGGFSVADFNYLCSTTSLSSVGVEVCSVDLRMLKEFVSVSAVNDVAALSTSASTGLNNAIVSESLHSTSGPFLADDNIVVSCMKDYVLEEHGLLKFVSDPEVTRDGLLYHYFTAAEVGGLRLAGMRLVFLEQKYIDFGNYKMFVSQPIQSFVNTSYDGPRPPLVGVWCFAFYSGALGSTARREISGKTGASGSASSVSRSVADTLRVIHGPDDCILAVRTDPQSMRARFGCKSANSRVRNIFYNIPFAADKIKAELRFWFGARTTPALGDASLSLLNFNQQKRLLVGITVETPADVTNSDDTPACSTNKVLSELQYAVYHTVTEALNNSVNRFTSMQVVNKTQFRQHFPQSSGAPALTVLVEYWSFASSVYLSSMVSALNQSVQQASATVLSSNKNTRPDGWKTEVFLTLSDFRDQTTAVTQQTGSLLAQLEVLKVVPDSHYRSHEDVGLCDTCLVTLQVKDSSLLAATQVADSPVAALVKLMRQFPTTCRIALIACKTNLAEDGSVFVLACLRGYQVLENVDHSVSVISESSGVSMRVLKGKRCLSELLLEFNLANIFIDGAMRDRAMYVPDSAVTQVSGTNSAAEAALVLFPPGQFVNTAVLLFPIPDSTVSTSSSVAVSTANSNVTLTRNLARVLNKLEKENFELIDILVTSDYAVSESLLSQLQSDNYSEYSYSAAEGVKLVSVRNFVAVVVRKNAALFKLKSLLGPMFNDDLALTSYPHSIAAHFAGGVTSASAASVVLYPTLTISSVQKTMSEVFATSNKSVSRSMTELYSQISSLQSLNNIHHSNDSEASSEDQDPTVVAAVAARSSVYFESRLRQCSSSHSLVTAPHASSVLAKSCDIAAIVVTHRLIQQNGLGTILEALHREGLSVVNIYVATVSPSLAKTLLDLTGASSLSLKPSQAHLTEGPAVFLGLEGPSHALIRLKSFGVAAKSTKCLWALDSSSSSSAGGAGTVWGIVASSSSRLAKDLFAYCFDRIHCSNSVFALNDSATTSDAKA